ncbi:GDSL esterase/lipase [Acorus calamus]|uniref:GDSL esterase/lipase n=1 Tax=Acorus calamus TaxID=4465 RepID=A0AAV9C9F7_ACOCL|nr:GDSL esterase/lipase [Acorus calamus]
MEMAPTFPSFTRLILLVLLLGLVRSESTEKQRYKAIYCFGDSLADTGNDRVLLGAANIPPLPYGETYFHRSTGRLSDGRLLIDFIAQEFGLPLLPPYLGGPGQHGFRHGVNFAVGGAIALNQSFLREMGINYTLPWSLDVEVGWFKQLLPSLCDSSTTNCSDFFSESLFFINSIGTNDVLGFLQLGENKTQVRDFVTLVVQKTRETIDTLIELGAQTMVVGGFYPWGCTPAFLTEFGTNNVRDYESETGCLKWHNQLSKYHDQLLKKEIHHARKMHPHATIAFANYYSILKPVFRSPNEYGFNGKEALVSCCGMGGRYNFNSSNACFNSLRKAGNGLHVCEDPASRLSWHGLHLTEAAYGFVARALMEGRYSIQPLS